MTIGSGTNECPVPVKADRSVNIERSSALIASTCGNARVGGDSANWIDYQVR